MHDIDPDYDFRQRHLTYRVLAMPADTNAYGDIFGGWLMSQADLAGSLPAHHAANGRVATVAVNSFQFIRPVLVGDLVSCYAWVTRIGNSSIEVRVEVEIHRERRTDVTHKVAEAVLTYVALTKEGKPRRITEPDAG
jgi:acyl-CoA thioesterase YciA